MVDKVTINPNEVRGLGDIVSPKTVDDFTVYMSGLSLTDGVYTLTYDETGTYLTLSASPTTIQYGSSTVFTAVLTQAGEPVEGETVSFYEGETLLGTDTTDSSGEATLTKSDFSIGVHSVKAVYDEVESSAVSVTVNKLTSTITLSVPASGTVGTSYTVSGTLVPTSGSVKLYENGSLKDTLTVSSGSFSMVITQSNEGTYSYYAVFEGSSTYDSVTSSTGSIVVSDVPTPVPDSVDLTGTKSILSYADSEQCVLTATVLDENDTPVEGVTVNLYNGSTLWDTLTTDSSGECTKTYSSAGSGDITFTAEVDGTLLTKTYAVTDAIYALSPEQTLSASASSDKFTPLISTMSLTLPNKFSLTFKLKNQNISGAVRFGVVPVSQKSSNSPTYSLYGQQATGTYVGVYRDSGTHAVGSDTSTTGTSYHDWEIVRDGNSFKWYFDGNQINSSITLSWFDTYAPHLLGWQYWRGGTANVKDIVLKPL